MEDLTIQDDKVDLRVPKTCIERVASRSPETEGCSSQPTNASGLSSGEVVGADVFDATSKTELMEVDHAKGNVTCLSVSSESSVAGDSGTTDSDAQRRRVIVRDLPCKVGCDRMKSELSALGFDGSYDVIEFPSQWNKRKGKVSFMGYGFIDFTSEAAATTFMSKFANHRFDGFQSLKTARVEFAASRTPSGGQAKRSQRLVIQNDSSPAASSA
eukprot:TRINITY_DN4463_c0_g2_i1.p1 TRINITY_DN4463_c0_g2~~TRINITY_DN4463_c0_g2_i1.p1  ORF type:complete len:214 (+),score=32.01 TRINITY_DN4463_c0_g2_i1:88-729(+)